MAPQPTRQSQDIPLVVDTIPTLVWSAHSDGSADFFNPSGLQYSSLSAEQALGWGWQAALQLDDLPRKLEALQETLDSGRTFETEDRWDHSSTGARTSHFWEPISVEPRAVVRLKALQMELG